LTKKGIELVLLVKQSIFNVHLFHSGVYAEMLISCECSGLLPVLSQFWMFMGNRVLHDAISWLDIYFITVHYPKRETKQTRFQYAYDFFKYFTTFKNLEHSTSLWVLPAEMLRLFQPDLLNYFQLLTISGTTSLIFNRIDTPEPVIRRIISISSSVFGFLQEDIEAMTKLLSFR